MTISTSEYEAIFPIIGLIIVAWLVRKKPKREMTKTKIKTGGRR